MIKFTDRTLKSRLGGEIRLFDVNVHKGYSFSEMICQLSQVVIRSVSLMLQLLFFESRNASQERCVNQTDD